LTQAYVGQEATFVNRTSKGEARETAVVESPVTQRYFELDALRVIAFRCTHFLSHRNVLR
jgi:hypothetical protein